jgi:hypothetical protein
MWNFLLFADTVRVFVKLEDYPMQMFVRIKLNKVTL